MRKLFIALAVMALAAASCTQKTQAPAASPEVTGAFLFQGMDSTGVERARAGEGLENK